MNAKQQREYYQRQQEQERQRQQAQREAEARAAQQDLARRHPGNQGKDLRYWKS